MLHRMETHRFATCAHCRDRIGVYEPTIAVGPGGTRRTSVASDPDLVDGDELLFHVECAKLIRQEIPGDE